MVNARLAAIVLLVAPCLVSMANAAGVDDIMGAWQRDDGIARVKVAPCGRVICMTNTYFKPGVVDEKVGERLEFNVKASGGAALAGTVLDPKTSKSYAASIDVTGEQMTTKGCILGGVICKSTGWTRIR